MEHATLKRYQKLIGDEQANLTQCLVKHFEGVETVQRLLRYSQENISSYNLQAGSMKNVWSGVLVELDKVERLPHFLDICVRDLPKLASDEHLLQYACQRGHSFEAHRFRWLHLGACTTAAAPVDALLAMLQQRAGTSPAFEVFVGTGPCPSQDVSRLQAYTKYQLWLPGEKDLHTNESLTPLETLLTKTLTVDFSDYLEILAKGHGPDLSLLRSIQSKRGHYAARVPDKLMLRWTDEQEFEGYVEVLDTLSMSALAGRPFPLYIPRQPSSLKQDMIRLVLMHHAPAHLKNSEAFWKDYAGQPALLLASNPDQDSVVECCREGHSALLLMSVGQNSVLEGCLDPDGLKVVEWIYDSYQFKRHKEFNFGLHGTIETRLPQKLRQWGSQLFVSRDSMEHRMLLEKLRQQVKFGAPAFLSENEQKALYEIKPQVKPSLRSYVSPSGEPRKSVQEREDALELVCSALESHAVVHVVGGPGSGKSTLLLDVQQHFLERDWVACRCHARKLKTIVAQARVEGFTVGFLKKLVAMLSDMDQLLELALHPVLILVDGLDEVENPPVQEFCLMLEKLTREGRRCHLVTASRSLLAPEHGRSFELVGLREEQQRLILETFCKLGRGEDAVKRAQQMHEALLRTEWQRALLSTPLTCILLARILRNQATELPCHRTALYERVIETLLLEPHRTTARLPQLPVMELFDIMGRIALRLSLKEAAVLAHETLTTELRGMSREDSSLQTSLEVLVQKSGIFETTEEGITFTHQTFQELCAARRLAQIFNNIADLLPSSSDDDRTYLSEPLIAQLLDDILTAGSARPAQWRELLATVGSLLSRPRADALASWLLEKQPALTTRFLQRVMLSPHIVKRLLALDSAEREVIRERLCALPQVLEAPEQVVALFREQLPLQASGYALTWMRVVLWEISQREDISSELRAEALSLRQYALQTFRPEHRREALRALDQLGWFEVKRLAGCDFSPIPVTNQLYQYFDPEHPRAFLEHHKQEELDRHPVVSLAFDEALCFAEWLQLDLPQESEWIQAAFGDNERLYPWGNDDPTEAHAHFSTQTQPRTSTRAIPSDWKVLGGIVELVGNVWEFCHPDDNAEVQCVIRGGSYQNQLQTLRRDGKNRRLVSKLTQSTMIGFRLVRRLRRGAR